MFHQVTIILSHPSHPGNIGATARAMKNMGFSKLILVNPKEYPSFQATAMASGAHDILKEAQVVHSLNDALKPFHYIIGASARHRTLTWPMMRVDEAASYLVDKLSASDIRVALLFGNEQSGLSNEELRACDCHCYIPTDDAYPSLNLSQAVQVTTYELRKTMMHSESPEKVEEIRKASFEKMEGFYDHLAETLLTLNIFNPKQPRQLMGRLRRLFNRAQMDETEINILRGIFKAVQKKAD